MKFRSDFTIEWTTYDTTYHDLMNFSILKIVSLNINGNLLDKRSNKDFCELVKKYDIFCNQESWLTETQNLDVENYKK